MRLQWQEFLATVEFSGRKQTGAVRVFRGSIMPSPHRRAVANSNPIRVDLIFELFLSITPPPGNSFSIPTPASGAISRKYAPSIEQHVHAIAR